MSKLSFRQTRSPRYRKAAILALPTAALLLVAGLAWSEVHSNAQHLYRWPFSEVGNYFAGARYQVNLSCRGQPPVVTATMAMKKRATRNCRR